MTKKERLGINIKAREAMQIAPERSKLLCEYITQILSDHERVSGEIRIDSAKINNERMLTFDISVPNKGFERHFNTGITTQQVDILTEQILNDLIDHYMKSDTIGCTKFFSVRGIGMNMDGISALNSIGSTIYINFVCRGNQFREQVKLYNARLDAYINQQKNEAKLK